MWSLRLGSQDTTRVLAPGFVFESRLSSGKGLWRFATSDPASREEAYASEQRTYSMFSRASPEDGALVTEEELRAGGRRCRS